MRTSCLFVFTLLGAGSASAWNVPLPVAYQPASTSAYKVASGRSVADMDHDGDPDVVVKKLLTGPTVHQLLWLKNAGATASNWAEVTISSGVDEVPLAAADLDHDGDADVLTFLQSPNDYLQWNESSATGTSWAVHLAFTNFPLGTQVNETELADLDRDGYPDLLMTAANTNQPLYWFANNQGGAWTQYTLAPVAQGSFITADVDRDGAVDVVRHESGRLVWYENQTRDGVLSNWTVHIVATNRSTFTKPVAVDADQDGDTDLFVQNIPAGWYENAGNGTSWVFHAQNGSFAGRPLDLDRDGDEDMVSEDYWYENPGRGGSTWLKRSFTNVVPAATDLAGFGDADEDGDLDVFVRATSNRLYLLRVDSPSLNFQHGTEQMISSNLASASDLEAADLDRDGDMDLVAASSVNGVVWFQNSGPGTSWTLRAIVTNGFDYSAVAVTDLDADGDPDVAASQLSGGDLLWLKNLDGVGGSWQASTVAVSMVSILDLDAALINGDDYDDLAATAGFNEQVVSWLNRDGSATNWLQKFVTNNLPGCYGLDFGDVDRDGDADLVATELSSPTLRWFRNPLGDPGTNWAVRTITTNGAGYSDASMADLDGDGDLDVVAVSPNTDRLELWINTDGIGTAWSNIVASSSFTDPYRILARDMNLDGRPDLVTTELGDNRVSVFYNTGLLHVWFRRNLTTSFTGTLCIASADFDDDGDVDLATSQSSGSRIAWIPKDGIADILLTKSADVAAVQFGGAVAFTLTVANFGPETVSGLVVTDTLPAELTWVSDSVGAGPPVGSNLVWNVGSLAIGQAATCVVHCAAAVLANEITVTNVASAAFPGAIANASNAVAAAAVRIADLYGTIATNLDGVSDAVVADFDGDGWLDVIAVVSNANAIVARRSQQATNWQVYTVSSSGFTNPTHIAVADFDRDGDLDTAAISPLSGRIAWWDNFIVGPSGGFAVNVASGHVGLASIEAADMDKDGDADLLVAVTDSSSVLWFENGGGPATNWTPHTVGTVANVMAARSADLDRDGDRDVAVATSGGATRRLMNLNGTGTSWSATLIGGGLIGASSLEPTDLDGDGDTDLVAASFSSGSIAIWENVDGAGGSWTQRINYLFLSGVSGIAAADWDGDGDADLVASGRNADRLSWWENLDRRGQHWTEHTLHANADGASSVALGDLDRDGSLDAVTAASVAGRLIWAQGAADPWPGVISDSRRQVLTNGWHEAGALAMFDVDRDGDLDLASFSRSNKTIRLWKNLDRAGTRWSYTNVTTSLSYMGGLDHGDLDGDGDEDLVSFPDLGNEGIWMWENTDGRGNAWTQRKICENNVVFNVLDSALCDFDRDGDLDVAVVAQISTTNRLIYWFANGGAAGGAWSTNLISTTCTNAETLDAGDLDRDGDADIAVGGTTVYALENAGGATNWIQHSLPTSATFSDGVRITDLDRNGTNDILHTAGSGIYLLRFAVPYTNPSDVLLGTAQNFLPDLYATDFDADGDLDVLLASSSYIAATDKVVVLENITTTGALAFVRAASAGIDAYGGSEIQVGDIDGDGDPDIAGSFYSTPSYGLPPSIAWWANRASNAVGIRKSVVPVTLSGPTSVTWTISVSNGLPVTANNILVADWLPPEAVYVSDSCGVGAPGTNVWIWLVGSLAPGATASCTITALVSAAGLDLVNQAQVTATASGFEGLHELDTAVASVANGDFDGDGLPDATDPDDDNDGMPDAWEVLYGFNPRNAADAFVDSDADGFSNLDEYVAMTTPTNGTDYFRISSMTITGLVTITYMPSSTSRLYTLQFSTNLAANVWTQTPAMVDQPGGSGVFTNSTGASNAAARVRVRVP